MTGKQPKKFADMKPRDRVAHLKVRMLETEDTQEIDKKLDMLFDTAGLGSEGDGAFVVGDTGIGKTTAVRMFTDRMYERLRLEDPSGQWLRPEVAGTDLRPIVHETATGLQRPIAVVLVGKKPTFNSFLGDTAEALKVSLPRNCRFGEAQRRVNDAIIKQRIKMVIFDEVQHIIEAGMNAYDAADVFKLLIKSRVQVICIGMMSALDLGEVNEQLDRLTRNRVMLQPLRCSISDFPQVDEKGKIAGPELQEITEFRQLMAMIDHRDGMDSVLPFDKPSNLSQPDLALRIHRAGDGRIGKIIPLIQEACKLAIYEGDDRVTGPHFAQAYREATRCDDADNWFEIPFALVTKKFGSGRQRTLYSRGNAKKQVEKHLDKRSRRDVEDAIAGRD